MPRPKKDRIVLEPPYIAEFKPLGVPIRALKSSSLGLDEFEALRLADYLGMDHNEAATEMEISRPTFTRLVESARRKMAAFIVEGTHLHIEGGKVHFRGNLYQCRSCGHMIRKQFTEDITRCPTCGSENLIDFAGGFGHGACCRRHNYQD